MIFLVSLALPQALTPQGVSADAPLLPIPTGLGAADGRSETGDQALPTSASSSAMPSLLEEPCAASFVPPATHGPQPPWVAPSLLESDWETYATPVFGYSIEHPPTLHREERADPAAASRGGVPSNLWLGERIQIVTRIPPLSDEALSAIWSSATEVTLPRGLQALRLERTSAPLGGGSPLTSIEYLIRDEDASYFLIYHPIGAEPVDDKKRQVFEAVVASFTLLSQRTYESPLVIQAADTDGFDFPVDPRDGSSGTPPWYASYDVQNPYLSDWSSCYGKPLSDLQHAGEDWFRSAGSNVYAVANGRVIWANENANYPGGVVIIEHTLPSGVSNPWGGNLIYSMYGHLAAGSLVAEWTDVQRGQVIGRVYDWGSNSHVHFEMRRYGNMGQAPGSVNGCSFCNTSWPGPGYTDTGCSPDWYGYTHPSNWIDSHRPGSGDDCSAPSLNSPGDGATSSDRTITFDWSAPSCNPDGYTFRVSTSSDMTIVSGLPDRGEGGTSTSETFDSAWDNTDLYWSVRACKPCEPYTPTAWATPRRFRIEPDTGPDCPQSGGVIFYKRNNYDCGGEGEGSGYVIRSSPGWENVPGSFNDQASSLSVPSGWSVKLFEHSDRGGASVCRDSDDSDFAGDAYDGGVGLNDTLSSFEVFDDGNCGVATDAAEFVGQSEYPTVETNQSFSIYFEVKNTGTTTWRDTDGYGLENINGQTLGAWQRQEIGNDVPPGTNKRWDIQMTAPSEPGVYRTQWMLNHWGETFGPNMFIDVTVVASAPDVPDLQTPAEGATFDEGEAITLSWSDTGDQYYGEVWGGPGGTLTFGWQAGTSKDIGSQWAGYAYSWHVEARNGTAESGWSSTRGFTVRPAAPSGLGVQAGACRQLNLAWNDNSGSEEGFRIFRNGVSIGTVGADTTEYQDTGVDPSTSYTYHVEAYRGDIDSQPSGAVDVTTPSCSPGPLSYTGHTADDDGVGDSSGNGDGRVDCGEKIELYVDLLNHGDGAATDLDVSISTDDPYVTWLYNTSSGYPDVAPRETGTNNDDFDFEVDPTAPDGHTVRFVLDVSASNGGPWSDAFDLPVVCINTPPDAPTSPSPAEGASAASINTDLTWASSDPDGDSMTYHVYLEADDATPDQLACVGVTSGLCNPGILSYETHYYWSVVATDHHGASSAATVWDFTTQAPHQTHLPLVMLGGDYRVDAAR